MRKLSPKNTFRIIVAPTIFVVLMAFISLFNAERFDEAFYSIVESNESRAYAVVSAIPKERLPPYYLTKVEKQRLKEKRQLLENRISEAFSEEEKVKFLKEEATQGYVAASYELGQYYKNKAAEISDRKPIPLSDKKDMLLLKEIFTSLPAKKSESVVLYNFPLKKLHPQKIKLLEKEGENDSAKAYYELGQHYHSSVRDAFFSLSQTIPTNPSSSRILFNNPFSNEKSPVNIQQTAVIAVISIVLTEILSPIIRFLLSQAKNRTVGAFTRKRKAQKQKK